MLDTLPDSRLIATRETVMADWPTTDGLGRPKTVRLELEPIYCFHCGKPHGYIPTGVMSFVSFLCGRCSENKGEEANALYSPDDEFWSAVAGEMIDRFGRALTAAELDALARRGALGRNLELLERDSPYASTR